MQVIERLGGHTPPKGTQEHRSSYQVIWPLPEFPEIWCDDDESGGISQLFHCHPSHSRLLHGLDFSAYPAMCVVGSEPSDLSEREEALGSKGHSKRGWWEILILSSRGRHPPTALLGSRASCWGRGWPGGQGSECPPLNQP